MDIKHIITFLKVAELKNFTKTAKELQYSQSTISFHIKSLERELNIKLFHRDSKKLKITDEGLLILSTCKNLRDTYYNLLDLSTNASTSDTSLKIASVNSILIYRLSDILNNFKNIYPSVNIELVNLPICDYSSHVKNNSVDIAFYVEPDFKDDSLTLVNLNREPMYLIYPNSHDFIDMKSLAHSLTACFSEQGCSYRYLLQKFHNECSMNPISTLESTSIEMIKKCVSSGIGYSILPKMCINEEMRLNSFKTILMDNNNYYVDLVLAYKKDRKFPSYTKHLLDLIKEEFHRE